MKDSRKLLEMADQYKRKNQYDIINKVGMDQKKEIAPCQGYRGDADMDAVEYKYPKQRPVKYVLRVTLTGSSPKVWREIAVPSTIKLTSLAHVIILAMGWEESHLSLFKKWRKEYHVYMDRADAYDYPIEDACEYALCDLLSAGEEVGGCCVLAGWLAAAVIADDFINFEDDVLGYAGFYGCSINKLGEIDALLVRL